VNLDPNHRTDAIAQAGNPSDGTIGHRWRVQHQAVFLKTGLKTQRCVKIIAVEVDRDETICGLHLYRHYSPGHKKTIIGRKLAMAEKFEP
jgi:hypothetical protein